MEITKSITAHEQHDELIGEGNLPTNNCSFQSAEHAALAYAKAGLSVLPINSNKAPTIPAWKDLQLAIASGDTIREWYSYGEKGVGIVCRTVSNNIECLDVDEKYNTDSTSLLDQLTPLVDTLASGLLSRLVHETSKNGGHHFVYRCSTIEGSINLARRDASAQELEEKPKEKSKVLIETKGEGGYFASYPSPGYHLISGSFLDIPEITEQERTVLFECSRALNKSTKEEKVVSGYPKKRRSAIDRPGDDFNTRGDIAPVLIEAGWKLYYASKGVQYWTRPGKSGGVSASFNRHPNMFYVFSSSCDPLEPFTWYTKFALLGLLSYSGDFSAAASDLYEKGYGASLVAKTESFLNQRFEFRYNVVTGRVEFKDKASSGFSVLQDYDLNSICRQLQYSHIKMSADGLASLLRSEYARPFDPFKEYYENLPVWDKSTDFIAQLASSVQLRNPLDKSMFEEYLRKWLVGAVGCAIDSNVANHNCFTLVGPQGYYKTTWLNRLLPPKLSSYLHVGTIDPENKDTFIHLSECFLINLDELETLNKHELGSLKSIMTMKENRIRRPYGHFADQLIRRASFVGSINKDSFLTDETGSRRFLVFEIASIDANHSVDIDKVHAQAYFLFKSGFRHWFDKAEITAVNERNLEFSVQTTEDELVVQYCVPGSDWITATQVANEVSGITRYSFGKASARDFGFALKKAGYPSKKLDGITRYAVRVASGFGFDSPSSGVQSGVRSGVDISKSGENNLFK